MVAGQEGAVAVDAAALFLRAANGNFKLFAPPIHGSSNKNAVPLRLRGAISVGRTRVFLRRYRGQAVLVGIGGTGEAGVTSAG